MPLLDPVLDPVSAAWDTVDRARTMLSGAGLLPQTEPAR
jgi:hypothetical protein